MSNIFNEPPSNYFEHKNSFTSDPTGNKLGSWAWLHTPAADFSRKKRSEKVSLFRAAQLLRPHAGGMSCLDLQQANDNSAGHKKQISLLSFFHVKRLFALALFVFFVGGIGMVAIGHSLELGAMATPSSFSVDHKQAAPLTAMEFQSMSDAERMAVLFDDPDKLASFLDSMAIGPQ